jgi:serine/threonine protein kinase
VFKAIDMGGGGYCAVKRIVFKSPSHRKAVDQEVSLLKKLARHHRFVPEIYDYLYDRFPSPTLAYIVMEYIDGRPLAKSVGIGWRARDVEQFLYTMLGYLEHMHAIGIVHRDLHPNNILETGDDQRPYVLIDFGLAKRGPQTISAVRYYGNPNCVSPEQFRGDPTDRRSDLYSIAAVTYALLTGFLPMETPERLSGGFLVPIHKVRRNVPLVVEKQLTKMLELDPARRPRSAREVIEALRAPRLPPVIQSPRRTLNRLGWASGLLSVLVISVLVFSAFWYFSQSQAAPQPCSAANSFLAEANCHRVLSGRSGQIWSLVVSPDHSLLASGTDSGKVQIWRVENGEPLWTIQAHTQSVRSVAFSPAGDIIASGAYDGSVRLWRVRDGVSIGTIGDGTRDVRSVAFSPDGASLAIGLESGVVQLRRVSDNSLLYELVGHSAKVNEVAFSPDGGTLASASSDLTVRLWSMADGTWQRTFSGHSRDVWSLAFSSDGTMLASGGWDATVRVWRVSDGRQLKTLTDHTGPVYSVAFSPDGELLAAADQRGRLVVLWSVDDWTIVRRLRGHRDEVYSVGFTTLAQQAIVVSGSKDGTIRLWRAR